MTEGAIKAADYNGVFVIKLEGDVRLTLSVSFDEFIDTMITSDEFSAVIFDLTAVEALDSTTLGLMAKISLLSQPILKKFPIIIVNNPSVLKALSSMGFQDIFRIVDQFDVPTSEAKVTQLEAIFPVDEARVKAKVIEAHQVLVGLNSKNEAEFKDLLVSLK